MSRCIITGCRLVIPAEHKAVWGDLFECADGEILVFGGNCQGASNRAVWEYEYPPETDLEMQVIVDTSDYTERRGIVTVHRQDAHLNASAAGYLRDSL